MNIKYLLISAVLGGLASFVWGAVYHAAIGIDQHTVHEFSDPDAVSDFLRKHTAGNGMYGTKQGVLAGINMTPDLADRTLNMGPQLLRQYIICVVAAGLLAWLLLLTSVRTALGAAGFFALVGLAAGVSTALSAWVWYNHSAPFALATLFDLVACFFFAGLVVGWARKKFAA